MKFVILFMLLAQTSRADDTFVFDNINMKTKYKDSIGNLWDTSILLTSDGSGKPVPLFQQDLVGNAENYYPTKTRESVIGRRAGVNNLRVDVWEGPTGTYVFPVTPQRMRIVSTSANDTGAGTGVQKIIVHYLDNTYAEATEEVTLNGTTPVLTTATNILRINRMYSSAVGSTGGPVGTVSLTNTAATVTYCLQTPTYNTSAQLIYTVPIGKTAYISHVKVGAGASAAGHFTQFELRASAFGALLYPGILILQDIIFAQDSGQSVNYPTPLPYPEKTDILVSVFSDAALANVSTNGALMGWVE